MRPALAALVVVRTCGGDLRAASRAAILHTLGHCDAATRDGAAPRPGLGFVHIGAHHWFPPTRDAMLHDVATRHNWTGLLVEPSPHVFEELQRRAATSASPHVPVQAALCARSAPAVPFYAVSPAAVAGDRRGRDGVERHGWRAPSAECGLDGDMGRGGGRRPPLQLFEDVGRRLDEETCPVVPRRDVVQHRIARRREPVVRADVDEAQAGPRRCTVSRRGVAVAERVQYGGPRRGPQVTAACAHDDERGEGWAHLRQALLSATAPINTNFCKYSGFTKGKSVARRSLWNSTLCATSRARRALRASAVSASELPFCPAGSIALALACALLRRTRHP